VGKMPADALFELMMAPKGIRRRVALAMPAGPNALGALAVHYDSSDNQVSTTESEPFVVENGLEKPPLKVLVESFLLAFWMKCRRADIFHRFAVSGSGGRESSRFSSQKSFSSSVAGSSARVRGRPQKAVPTFGKLRTRLVSFGGVVVHVAGRRFFSSCRERLLRRSAKYWRTLHLPVPQISFFEAWVFRLSGILPRVSSINPNSSEAYRDKVGLFLRCRQGRRRRHMA